MKQGKLMMRRVTPALLLALALQPPGPGAAAEPAAAVDEVERYLLVDPPAHARLNEQRLYVERYAALAVALGGPAHKAAGSGGRGVRVPAR